MFAAKESPGINIWYVLTITHYAIMYTSLVHNMRKKKDTLIAICDHRTRESLSLIVLRRLKKRTTRKRRTSRMPHIVITIYFFLFTPHTRRQSSVRLMVEKQYKHLNDAYFQITKINNNNSNNSNDVDANDIRIGIWYVYILYYTL